MLKENIERRISECNREAKSKPIFLIIPFTMSGSRKKNKTVNRDCILKPIENPRKNYHVLVIYLKKRILITSKKRIG